MSRFAMSKFSTVEDRAEAAGYDAGLHGANTENCNTHFFGTQAESMAWDRGKKRGDAERGAVEPPKEAKQ